MTLHNGHHPVPPPAHADIVLPGVLTEKAQAVWTAALQRLQALQDSMIMLTDWNE